MSVNHFTKRRLAAVLLAGLVTGLAGNRPAAAQGCDPVNHPVEPYLFILFDTSGSTNYSPPCTQDQFDAGQCSFLCPTGDCYVPLHGDDPASKFFQMREALYTVIENNPYHHLGFASNNQDSLRVPSKHWLYQAQGDGPTISGWGPYPAAGAKEVFGALWNCDTGNGDNNIGCTSPMPADLPDAWELARVQRLPKGGAAFNQSQVFFLRNGSTYYKATYTPAPGSTPGAAVVSFNVRIDRCSSISCSSFTMTSQQTVTWSLISDFLSWDIGSTSTLNRNNPGRQYFTDVVNDAVGTNLCANWDPNTDSASDPFSGYNLRWSTVSDPRGSVLAKGDVIPLDWLRTQQQDIMIRLAPNLANGATTPDFRTATYLQDLPQGSETFLRLRNPSARTLIPLGAFPLAEPMYSFRQWYAAWQSLPPASDPDWICRAKSLLILTDDPSICGTSINPCTEASTLLNQYGVKTYVVSFGAQPGANTGVSCVAANGGTGNAYYPQTKQELIDDLNAVFTAAITP